MRENRTIRPMPVVAISNSQLYGLGCASFADFMFDRSALPSDPRDHLAPSVGLIPRFQAGFPAEHENICLTVVLICVVRAFEPTSPLTIKRYSRTAIRATSTMKVEICTYTNGKTNGSILYFQL
jgi:hypothetical protein